MMRTLQYYVTRELLKTFALTAVGLTLTFSLCGGVLQMIQAEVVTAVHLARMLGFVLPISATLTLPVAALFACAMVYGRLASDNEIDACKASGININRLLWPAFGLSIATAAFTYTFTNHLIPKFVEQLDLMVRRDIQKVVYQALRTRGHIKFQNFVLFADRTHLFDEQEDVKTIQIDRAAFLELDGDTLARCGTARQAQVHFHGGQTLSMPMVEASLFDIQMLDLRRKELFEAQQQAFDPMSLPSRVVMETKWLTLPQLLYYHEHPMELPSIKDQLMKLRWLVREAQFYKYAYEQLTTGEKKLVLADDRYRYEIQAAYVTQDEASFRPILRDVTVREQHPEGWRRHKADTCRIDVSRSGLAEGMAFVHIELKSRVVTIDSVDPTSPIEINKRDLDRIVLKDDLPGMDPPVDQETLLGNLDDPSTATEKLPSLHLGRRVDYAREGDRRDVLKLGQEITGIIHSRLAFSGSSLVVLIFAAALGIICRGGQMLTAFTIAFIPGLLVVVLNIMGRQLTENTGTHMVGIVVIWAGLVLLAIADVVILTRFIRR